MFFVEDGRVVVDVGHVHVQRLGGVARRPAGVGGAQGQVVTCTSKAKGAELIPPILIGSRDIMTSCADPEPIQVVQTPLRHLVMPSTPDKRK